MWEARAWAEIMAGTARRSAVSGLRISWSVSMLLGRGSRFSVSQGTCGDDSFRFYPLTCTRSDITRKDLLRTYQYFSHSLSLSARM